MPSTPQKKEQREKREANPRKKVDTASCLALFSPSRT
jgi:hypothetical protein